MVIYKNANFLVENFQVLVNMFLIDLKLVKKQYAYIHG